MLSTIRFCFPLLFLFQPTVTPVDAAPKAALEIFSYWTSGSEAAALKALLDLYKEQNPGVDIVNATVAGVMDRLRFQYCRPDFWVETRRTHGKPTQDQSSLTGMSPRENANRSPSSMHLKGGGKLSLRNWLS